MELFIMAEDQLVFRKGVSMNIMRQTSFLIHQSTFQCGAVSSYLMKGDNDDDENDVESLF